MNAAVVEVRDRLMQLPRAVEDVEEVTITRHGSESRIECARELESRQAAKFGSLAGMGVIVDAE